jgi:thiamine kinase-like enzyme
MPHKELEALALRWVPGGGPVQMQPMSRGLVNASFLVKRDGRRYVMRLATEGCSDLGQDREWECRVLDCAAKAGLAPMVQRCEVPDGVLISDWVECRAWTPDELALPENVRAMAQLLRRVHALTVPAPARMMNPAAWIRHYTAALDPYGPQISRRSQALRVSADLRLAQLAGAPPASAVLCHSDLHRFNVAVGRGPREPLLLLDWEYAHVADAHWDLAGWAANNDWTGDFAAGWLAAYLGRPALAEEAGRLSLWMWLYDYVCLLWSELYLNRAPEEAIPGVEQRVETLCKRLAIEAGSRAG